MIKKIKVAIKKIEELSKSKPIKIISSFNTDGIISATIMARTFQRWNKKFSLKVVKTLDDQTISSLPNNEILIFLDLASDVLNHLNEKKTEIFIFDRHEILGDISDNMNIINPLLEGKEAISSAAICYFFAKELSPDNKDLSNLTVVSMVETPLGKNLSKDYESILGDAEIIIKKGLLLYPSTRPVDRVLEYSSALYIPGVTGSYKGVMDLLKEANIERAEGKFKALCEFTEEEMSRLITSVTLRMQDKQNSSGIIGDLYLVKFLNKLEDAREVLALIDSCSKINNPKTALGFCLGNKKAIEDAEKTYIEYKHNLVSALRYISETDKISGKNYTIINARNNIKESIIGTVASIISHSSVYSSGTMIIALAYDDDKIKVSARLAGKEGRNVKEVLSQVVIPLGGEVGGHFDAAGGLISKEKEKEFIQELQKVLELELIKV